MLWFPTTVAAAMVKFAVTEVSLTGVKLTDVTPNVTAVTPVSPVPVMVTPVPPAAGPVAGDRLVTVGAGR